MRRKLAIVWVVIVVVVAAGAAVWYFLLRPPPLSDREQIINMIADRERAVEQAKVSDVMRYVAPDYQDPQGYDHRKLQRLVIQALRSGNPIDVVSQITDKDMHIQGDSATVKVDVDYSLGEPVGMGETQHVSVTATLRRERGGWKIVRSTGWQEAAGQAL